MADPPDIGINEDQSSYDDDGENVASRSPFTVDRLAGKRGGIVGRRVASFWLNQIIDVDDDKEFKRWLKRGSTIEKRYRDERNRTDEDNQRRVNSLWANVEILTPALYGKCPVPTCERRFRDKDPTGRGAAQMIERALQNEIEICGFDESMRQALRDYLLSGRGSVWIRYEPEVSESVSIPTDDEQDQHDSLGNIRPDDDSPEEEKLRETGDRVTRESTPVDFIQWTDFYTFPSKARIWKEVTAVGKRVYMTRNQMKRRFGNEIGRAIPFQKDDRKTRRQEDSRSGHEIDEKAQVFEIWDKSREEVVWVAEGYQYLCDRQDDPLKIENFFPCPKPLYSNATNNTLIPVPDFIQYQDQAIQIDELTQRISMLAKACKVAGVYNAAAKGIQRLFNESVENEMIPVDDWSAFAEKGGVAGNLSFIPLKEIMGVIEELTKIKERATAEMDRLTGINDIMRGVSDDERETLGGKRLKSAASGTRLQHRQDEVARFARDTLKIMADIMCQHFSPKSLIEVSGAMYEQGLGTMDVPTQDMLQNGVPPVSLGPPGSPPGPGGSFSPAGAGASMGGPPTVPRPPVGGPPGTVPPPGPQGPGALPQKPLVPPNGVGMSGGLPPGQGPPMGGLPPGGLPSPAPGQPPPPRPGLGFQGPMQPPQPPPIPPEMKDKMEGLQRIFKAIQLIRDERLLGFRVDIEVESTIYADQAKEGQDRTAFIMAVTKYLEQSVQISMAMPEAVPLLGKFLRFGVRGQKVGRELEQAIEDFTDEAVVLAKQRQQHASQQPNPEQIKAQAMMEKAKADIQQSQMKMQTDQQSAQAEVQRQAIENQGEAQNAAADTEQKQIDMEMRKLELQIELIRLQMEQTKANNALDIERQKSQTSQQENYIDQQQSTMGHAVEMQKASTEMQKTFLEGAQEHHKMTKEAELAEQEQQAQKKQFDHERKMQQGEHKIAQTKLQQQRAAASRPRAQ